MIDLKPACRETSALVRRLPADHLDAPTPCTEYTVTDLVDHLAEGARGFTAVARGVDPESLPSTATAGSAATRATAEAVLALGEAWDAPTAWRGASGVPGGPELPNEVWGRVALTEVVVHGWDLARATHLPFALPEETLQACLDHVRTFLAAAPLPALWGTPVELPADAPLLDQVVAVTGRDPRAWPAE